jgi:TonB family protein
MPFIQAIIIGLSLVLCSYAEAAENGTAVEDAKKAAEKAYRLLVLSQIEAEAFNPRTNKAGVSVVRFGVHHSGRLGLAEIHKSSGNAELDEAAVWSVRKAGPFPPFPKELEQTHALYFFQTFNFTLSASKKYDEEPIAKDADAHLPRPSQCTTCE